jgi:3-phosphoshikimate 1-carboxyvinyltransferase
MLICAAFSDNPTAIICPETSKDIEATAECLQTLGAKIQRTDNGYYVIPATDIPAGVYLNCRESGSTLRFLLPVIGALGVQATIKMEGRLPRRPLAPLWEEMQRMGCKLSRPAEDTILCEGRLLPGAYSIAGDISSQFISGLMMALPLIHGESRLEITGNTASLPYVEMTKHVQQLFSQTHSQTYAVEGDWSSAAFWLAANALGCNITVAGLTPSSPQGDSAIAYLLPQLKGNVTICAKDIPDLIPVLSVVAAANKGAVFTDIARLRLKESDRVTAIVDLLSSLGGKAEATENTLTVYGTGLIGGTVRSHGDHRIAMSAAIAATVCKETVTILGAECVKKSYPRFWEEYTNLGGMYEKQLR